MTKTHFSHIILGTFKLHSKAKMLYLQYFYWNTTSKYHHLSSAVWSIETY